MSVDVLAWNIQEGGFNGHRHAFDGEAQPALRPEREQAIHKIITEQREAGVNTAALIDTFGWRETYGGNTEIAKHLGFAAAHFINLADDRIERVLGKGAGLTFATNLATELVRPLDLDNR